MRVSGGVLFVTALVCLAGVPGGKAGYLGGTLASLAQGVQGGIDTTDEHSFIFASREAVIRVPWQRIHLIEYGQRVNRRYAMAILVSPILLLAKKRAHFLTVGFTDEAGREQAMLFRIDKNDIRRVLVAMEARTGRKVEFQDEEARKAGKG
jgi:hypothetical protein